MWQRTKGRKGYLYDIYGLLHTGKWSKIFGGHVPFFFGFRLFAFSNVFLIIIRKKLVMMLAEKGQACVFSPSLHFG